jgi:tetratricopeptide (TPR) repeat protein
VPAPDRAFTTYVRSSGALTPAQLNELLSKQKVLLGVGRKALLHELATARGILDATHEAALARVATGADSGTHAPAPPIQPAPEAAAPVVRAATSPLRCPFCHEGILVSGDWIACEACLARHHRECWQEGSACSACGCASFVESTRRQSGRLLQQPAAPEMPSRRFWRLPVIGVAVILTVVGVGAAAVALQHVLQPGKTPHERAAELHAQGERERERANLASAIKKFTQALELDPKNTEILFDRAFVYVSRAEYQAARDDYDAILALEPRNGNALIGRGNVRDHLGDARGALADFGAAIETDPANPVFWYDRGNGRRAIGDHRGAVADYTKAISLDPSQKEAWRGRGNEEVGLGDLDASIDDYEKVLVLERDPVKIAEMKHVLAHNYHEKAGVFLRANELEKGRKLLDRSLELEPTLVPARLDSGLCYDALKDLRRGIAEYDTILAADPKNWSAYYSRAVDEEELGEPAAALKDLGRCLEVNPECPQALFKRANLESKAGNKADALEDFGRFIAIMPNNAVGYHNRGLTRQAMNDYAGALEDFDREVELHPNGAGYASQGVVLALLKRTGEARASLDKAVALDPEKAEIWYERAAFREQSMDLTGAAEDYGRFLAFRPDDLDARQHRAFALQRIQRWKEALAEWTIVVEGAPRRPGFHPNRGLCRQNVGDDAGAIEDFTFEIELNDPTTRPVAVAWCYGHRGTSRRHLKDYAGSLADIKKALELTPGDFMEYLELGDTHSEMSNYAAAVEDFTRVIDGIPNDPSAYFNRAGAYYRLADYGAALADYEKVLAIDPAFVKKADVEANIANLKRKIEGGHAK